MMRSLLKDKLIELLKRSEKITRTDNLYLTKSFSFLWSFQTLTLVCGFILYYVFAQYVSKETYGEYKYYITLFELFALTSLTGTKISLAPAISRGFYGTLPALFKKRIFYSLFGSLLGLITAIVLAKKGQNDVAITVTLISLLGPWIHSSGLTTSYMTGIKDFSFYAKSNSVLELLSFTFTIAIIAVRPEPLILFIAYLAGSSGNLIIYYILQKNLKNNKIDTNALPLGKYYSFLDGFNILAAKIDSLILFHLLGPSSLALYSFALIPVDQIRGYLNHIQSIAVPKLSVGDYSVLRKSLTARMPLFMLIITMIVLIYAIIATQIYTFIFPAYKNATIYSQLYAISLIFGMPAIVYQALFQSHGKKIIVTRINIMNNVLQITSMILGAIFYGILGVITARIFTSIATCFISMTYAKTAGTDHDTK